MDFMVHVEVKNYKNIVFALPLLELVHPVVLPGVLRHLQANALPSACFLHFPVLYLDVLYRLLEVAGVALDENFIPYFEGIAQLHNSDAKMGVVMCYFPNFMQCLLLHALTP
jgi:hypothetical protein